jgi:hypothetical protein
LVLVSAIFFSEAPPTPISLSSTGSPSWRKSSETIVSCAQPPAPLARSGQRRAHFTPRFRYNGWDGFDRCFGRLRFAALLAEAVGRAARPTRDVPRGAGLKSRCPLLVLAPGTCG